MVFGKHRPVSMVLDEPESQMDLFHLDGMDANRIVLDFKEQSVLLDNIPSALPRDRIASNGVKAVNLTTTASDNNANSNIGTYKKIRNRNSGNASSKRNRIVSMPEFSSSTKDTFASLDNPPKSERRRSKWFSKAFHLGGDHGNELFDALPYQYTDPNTVKPVRKEVPWATAMEQRSQALHLDKELPTVHNNLTSAEASESSIPPRRRPLWDAYPGGQPVSTPTKKTQLWEAPPSVSSREKRYSSLDPQRIAKYNSGSGSGSNSSLEIQETYAPSRIASEGNNRSFPDLQKSLPSIQNLLPPRSSGLPSLRYEPPVAQYKPTPPTPPQESTASLPRIRHLPSNHPYRLGHENTNPKDQSDLQAGRRFVSAPQPSRGILKKPLPVVRVPVPNTEKGLPPIQKELPPINKEKEKDLPPISKQVKELPPVVGKPLTTTPRKSPFSQRNKVVGTMVPALGRNEPYGTFYGEDDNEYYEKRPSPSGEQFYQTQNPHDTSNGSTIKGMSPDGIKSKHIIVDDEDDNVFDGMFGADDSPQFIPLSDSEDYAMPSYLLFINNAFDDNNDSVREISPVPDYVDIMKQKEENTNANGTLNKHKPQLSNDSDAPNYWTYARSNDQSSFSDSLFSDLNYELGQSPPELPRLEPAVRARSSAPNATANRNSMFSTSSTNSGLSLKEAKKAIAHEIAQHEFKYPLDTNRNYDDYTRFIYPKEYLDKHRAVSASITSSPQQYFTPESSPTKSPPQRNISSAY